VGKIIFVDDQIDLYDGQVKTFQRMGHEVNAVDSHQRFYAAFIHTGGADLVITDFMDAHGTVMKRLEFLDDYCRRNKLKPPAVIVYTAACEESVRRECRRLCVEDLLTAVIDKSDLSSEFVEGKRVTYNPELTEKVRSLLGG